MERTQIDRKPIEIRRLKGELESLGFETVLSFGRPLRLAGISMSLQNLSDRHFIASFANDNFLNPVEQKLTFGRQYEIRNGPFVFRGSPILVGSHKYLFLEFNYLTRMILDSSCDKNLDIV